MPVIECMQRRKGGSDIVMKDGTIYHFAPVTGSSPKHVCEIEDPGHIGTLLAIKEGFRYIGDRSAGGDEKKASPASGTAGEATDTAKKPRSGGVVQTGRGRERVDAGEADRSGTSKTVK